LKNKLLLFIFLALIWSGIATKASFAAVPIPKGHGVCIQFGISAQELDMIKNAGFTIARTDLKWGNVERSRGQYDWTSADQLVNNLTSRGIRPYLILDYNNGVYGASQELQGINTQDQINGYANFAKAAAARYKGKGIIWEIWNEPNLDVFWRPTPNSSQYMALVKAAAPAIKSGDSEAIVVAPAVAFIANTLSFLDECGAQGLFGLVDAVSVHPYKDAAPETGSVDYLYDSLRTIIARHNPSNPNLPIIGGEFGFSVTWSSVQNENTQSQFLTRQLLYHDYKNIPISMIYDFKNDGTNLADSEANFGIVRNDLSLKPAYTAIKTLNETLTGMSFSKRLTSASNDYIYEYTNSAGAKAYAAWTTGSAHAVTINNQSVTISNSPVYLKTAGTPVATVPAAPTNLQVVNVTKGATTGAYYVNLTWTDNSGDETGFQIQQSVNSTNTFQSVATPAAGSTGFSINLGTAPVTGTYYYKVLSINSTGASQPSNTVNANVQIAKPALVPVPKGQGTCISSMATTQDLDMIKSAGLTIARTDLKWGAVEQVKGQYNWTTYDQLVNNLTSRGIRPYFILDYNNTNYGASSELQGISTQEQINGYANFANAAAARYKDKGIIWEIWNEPNRDQFWTPVSNASQYMALVKAAAPAIKAADPNAIVVAPAEGFIANTFTFLEECAAQGLFGLVDAVSVHPYKDAAPETGSLDYLYDTVKSLIAKYNPANPNLPIIAGEFGFSVPWSSVLNENTQAQYLTRQLLYNDYKNIPISMIYDFKNDGTSTTDAEANFGLVRADSSLKPAYTAIQALSQSLAGMSFSSKLPSASGDYIFEYTNSAGAKTAVAWTTGAAHSTTVYNQSVNLSSSPVYVKPVLVTIPASPSNLQVVNVTKGATTGAYFVNLSWTDNSANETGFQIQQALNTDSNYATVATADPNSTSYSINLGTSPTQGTYYYKALAINSAGSSQPSNVVNANVVTSTPAPVITVPKITSVKMGVKAATGEYSAIIKWADNATDELSYDVYQSAGDQNNFQLLSSLAASPATSTITSTISIGVKPVFGTYYYKIVAKYANNKTETSNIASAIVKEYIPLTPANLKSAAVKDTNNKPAVVLSWGDKSINETGFNIYSSDSTNGTFTKIGTTDKDVIMVVNPLNNAGTYYYKITSFNSAGESPDSTVVPAVVN